ncbi:MAG: type 1 glutamine amidotransferase [Thiolinea sp.]
MHIAVLNLCKPDEGLEHFGTISSMIIKWLNPHLPEAELTEIHIATGAPLPAFADYDGYILSGSEKGVYDEAEWMEPLRAMLLQLKEAQIPVFGICFGHQLMADTYGGKAEKSDKGFVVGPREFTADGQQYAARVMHQDQVTEKPPNAEITASAPYCPVAALQYNFPACSVQFHPEYPHSFIAEATEKFDGNIMTAQEAIDSRESLARYTVADDLYGAETAAFFRKHIMT